MSLILITKNDRFFASELKRKRDGNYLAPNYTFNPCVRGFSKMAQLHFATSVGVESFGGLEFIRPSKRGDAVRPVGVHPAKKKKAESK